MKYTFALAAAAAAMAPMPAFAATNILVNGGFENPTVTNGCCTTTPSDPLPGWTVSQPGDVNVVIGTYGSTNGNLAFQASQYLDLIGQSGNGNISQTFNTIEGMIYNLTFAYSHNIFRPPFAPIASADFAVIGSALAGSVTHSTGSTSNLDWITYSNTFAGTGGEMTLTFANTLGADYEGIFLDGISITATPEPSTWLMLILGFGLAGSSIRSARRRKAGMFA